MEPEGVQGASSKQWVQLTQALDMYGGIPASSLLPLRCVCKHFANSFRPPVFNSSDLHQLCMLLSSELCSLITSHPNSLDNTGPILVIRHQAISIALSADVINDYPNMVTSDLVCFMKLFLVYGEPSASPLFCIQASSSDLEYKVRQWLQYSASIKQLSKHRFISVSIYSEHCKASSSIHYVNHASANNVINSMIKASSPGIISACITRQYISTMFDILSQSLLPNIWRHLSDLSLTIISSTSKNVQSGKLLISHLFDSLNPQNITMSIAQFQVCPYNQMSDYGQPLLMTIPYSEFQSDVHKLTSLQICFQRIHAFLQQQATLWPGQAHISISVESKFGSIGEKCLRHAADINHIASVLTGTVVSAEDADCCLTSSTSELDPNDIFLMLSLQYESTSFILVEDDLKLILQHLKCPIKLRLHPHLINGLLQAYEIVNRPLLMKNQLTLLEHRLFNNLKTLIPIQGHYFSSLSVQGL